MPSETSTAVTFSVVVVVVIIVIAIALVFYWTSRKRQTHRTEPAPTIHRMTTPVATAVVTPSISVPMVKNTSTRSAVTANAELVMPSISSADDFANIPVATAQYEEETGALPVAETIVW